MDMLPVSVMSQEGRDSQYIADMTQSNSERSRNEALVDCNQQATKDNWYANQVTSHEN